MAPEYALTVSPVRIELAASPGEQASTFVSVRNSGALPVTLQGAAADFLAQGEVGEPRFVPAGQSEWSMSRWVSSEPARFTLKPGEGRRVEVKIAVPRDAEPGGHYSAELFSTAPSDTGQTAVVAQVGTLLLLTVDGDVIHGGTAAMTGPRVVQKGPLPLGVRFQNVGTIHVEPKGEVMITRLWGAPVEAVGIEAQNVLPASARLLRATWAGPGIGAYLVRAEMTFGSPARRIVSPERLVIVFPWGQVLMGIVLLALAIGLARPLSAAREPGCR